MPEQMPTASWGSFQPGGSVPQAPASAATQPQGDPVLSMIQQMVTPISKEDIQAAVTPIPGAHAAQIPSNFVQPLHEHQDASYDTRRVVGAGNARARGIGNAITGVTNVIGRIASAEAQQKQNQVRDAATKVITAQHAIDESQQQLDMAMQSNDTATVAKMKDSIQQNTSVRDGIFADPKLRKALQKGFDISYTDPQSNKTDEHAAVQAAMKDAKTFQEKREAAKKLQAEQNQKSGAAMGAAFAKQQPQGLAPNTVAQQKVSLAMAQQKMQQQALKDYLNFKQAMAGHSATVQAASIREIGAGILQQARFNQAQDMLGQRFTQQQELLRERFNNSVKLVGIRATQARKTAGEIYSDRQANPLGIYTKTRAAYAQFSQNAVKDAVTLTELQNQRLGMYLDKNGKALKPNPDDVHALDSQIQLVQQQVNADKQTAANLQQQANKMASVFGFDSGSIDNGANSSGEPDSSNSNQSDAVGGEVDFSDPFTYLQEGSEEDQ